VRHKPMAVNAASGLQSPGIGPRLGLVVAPRLAAGKLPASNRIFTLISRYGVHRVKVARPVAIRASC
jgi:hypothetical protein